MPLKSPSINWYASRIAPIISTRRMHTLYNMTSPNKQRRNCSVITFRTAICRGGWAKVLRLFTVRVVASLRREGVSDREASTAVDLDLHYLPRR